VNNDGGVDGERGRKDSGVRVKMYSHPTPNLCGVLAKAQLQRTTGLESEKISWESDEV
jgi:hypothetical protein